ncbi:Ran GTPase-activating protein [Encephalitozoon hellem ATCC 50504]|uniref:Ran GTPase activating protein n=1 Tax=Encephalitozoon hellem TaxID=27973 RepID=A0A9Q9CC67_ENCHE|nr:Ran GTPase-activating protein [Encephalitozoon hellem ATCC 50504]AFM98280.1 Ran GTPase-activating protein [Encephalitozoon hellem ATCC 50504]UTX43158.1 Ran GTPase activating protein [Encephalitozoon hellem]WEL38615.1 Ran GTPase activating protein [Encephalitozoon hellem]|eukprot:XP_003887261.1 Ran GTPase-activating protein [Encephalitozoon hellem ATCC 50504]
MIFSIGDQKKKYETKEDVSEVVGEIRKTLDELVEVDLSGNYFSEEAMEEICSALKDAKSLRIINLSSAFLGLDKEKLYNNLVVLSNMLRNHRIQKIDLSDNAISSEFPPELGEFISSSTDLIHLKMNNCGLGKIGGSRLGNYLLGIADKSKLEVVDIAQNRFFSFPKELSDALQEFENIKELRIQYNTIEEETMLSFLRSFGSHSLEVLDIRDNFLSPEGSRYLGDLYCEWNLKELRVGDCMMGNEGVKDFLRRASKKFTPMSLPGDYNSRREGIVLDISYNEFEQDAVEPLIDFCKRNVIKELSVFGNYYDDIRDVIEVVEKQGGVVTTKEHTDVSSDEGLEIDESVIEGIADM